MAQGKKQRWWYAGREAMQEYKANKKIVKNLISEAAEHSSTPEDMHTGKHYEIESKGKTTKHKETTKQYIHGSGTSDPTMAAYERLERDRYYQRLREKVKAVDAAIYITERMADGGRRMKLINGIYNSLSNAKMNIEIAAFDMHESPSTAGNWHSDFLYLIGVELGECESGKRTRNKYIQVIGG